MTHNTTWSFFSLKHVTFQTHTACRFAEKTRISAQFWPGDAERASRFPCFNVETL